MCDPLSLCERFWMFEKIVMPSFLHPIPEDLSLQQRCCENELWHPPYCLHLLISQWKSHSYILYSLCPSSHFYKTFVRYTAVITVDIQIMWYSENRGSRFLYPNYMMSYRITELCIVHTPQCKSLTFHTGLLCMGGSRTQYPVLRINTILCRAKRHVSVNYKIIFSSG